MGGAAAARVPVLTRGLLGRPGGWWKGGDPTGDGGEEVVGAEPSQGAPFGQGGLDCPGRGMPGRRVRRRDKRRCRSDPGQRRGVVYLGVAGYSNTSTRSAGVCRKHDLCQCEAGVVGRRREDLRRATRCRFEMQKVYFCRKFTFSALLAILIMASDLRTHLMPRL